MLEIIAIIYFSKIVGNLAENKGYKKGWYIALFVFCWLLGEFVGALFGSIQSQGPVVYLYAIFGAAAGGLLAYLIVYTLSDKSTSQIDATNRPSAVVKDA